MTYFYKKLAEVPGVPRFPLVTPTVIERFVLNYDFSWSGLRKEFRISNWIIKFQYIDNYR